MCFYCGCREIPLIREFIAEHEEVNELASELAQALGEDELEQARVLIGLMAAQLEAHWQGEEQGLFSMMHGEEQFAAYIDELVEEHRGLRALLERADLRVTVDRGRLLAALDELRRHVAKEEDGLFPASLTALSGEEWDHAMDAWQKAHPTATRSLVD